MDVSFEPLSKEARALLVAALESDHPTAEARRRVRRAVERACDDGRLAPWDGRGLLATPLATGSPPGPVWRRH